MAFQERGLKADFRTVSATVFLGTERGRPVRGSVYKDVGFRFHKRLRRKPEAHPMDHAPALRAVSTST